MIYNSNVNMTIDETKVKNNSLNYLNENRSYYSNIQNPELFSEFDETIEKMQSMKIKMKIFKSLKIIKNK